MVFSFFKKQPNKMPERPAAKPRPLESKPLPESPPPAALATESVAPAEALPDLEFTAGPLSLPAAEPALDELAVPALRVTDDDSSLRVEDFSNGDFAELNGHGIKVNHDVDPLQSCIEQVVVLYANGQDAAARSLLENFVHAYPGSEGQRLWLMLFDLLQLAGDRAVFDKLAVEFAELCETSPPNWRTDLAGERPATNAVPAQQIALQGVLTAEVARPINELAELVDAKQSVAVDWSKLIGCDDEVAAHLADLLRRARQQRTALTLQGADAFIARLSARLVVSECTHEPSWRLLLELLQRQGDQAVFEERAVDYAVTFERSPPSWEPGPVPVVPASAPTLRGDDAYYLVGELKNCRFDELVTVLERSDQPILDFSGVRRLDFFSAGQLVNRLSPCKAAGKEIIIRNPNHLIAELMAVVGLNKQARIIVPKS